MPVILTNTEDLRPELYAFLGTLRTCVGPCGKLQLLTSATNRTKVTSASSRLLPELQQSVSNPILMFLLQAAQAQIQRFQDGGLWTCICAGQLLDGVIKDQAPSLLNGLACYGLNLLSHSAVRVDVSLNSVHPLLLIVESVLRSKPTAFGAACSDIPSVALAVVKGFIEAEGTLQNLAVQGETGLGEPFVLPGLLFKTSGDELALLHGTNWEHVPVVLVSRMLTDVDDPLEKAESNFEIEGNSRRKIEAACRLVNLIIKAGIRVLACQRVVHPQAALLARRSGVLILPRLGRQVAARLEKLSGAKAIREDPAEVTTKLLLRSQGRLKNVRREAVGGHDFIVLGGEIHTLLLHAPTCENSAELNAVVNQALAALSCAVADSAVLPGAGCIEVWLCAQLWGKVVADRESGIPATGTKLSVLRSIQLSLLSAAGMDIRGGTLSVDSQAHHAWHSSTPDCIQVTPGMRCKCGLLNANSLNAAVRWSIVNEMADEPLVSLWDPSSFETRLDLLHGQCNVVLDALSAKRNAFKLAIEMASTLSSVGATLL